VSINVLNAVEKKRKRRKLPSSPPPHKRAGLDRNESSAYVVLHRRQNS
jgi:hypothetical protein